MKTADRGHKKIPALEFSTLALVITAGLIFFLWLKSQDINFCRNVVSNLVNGRYSVEKHIDWDNFKGMGIDVGAAYTKFPNEVEKKKYKIAFISNLSSGFKRVGGNFRSYVNWRVYSREADKVVIAADSRNGKVTTLFTLSVAGKKKLVSVQIK